MRSGLVLLAACAPVAPVASSHVGVPPEHFGLAEPPQQHAPWTPPAGVDPNLDKLFAQGMADPRGLDYRDVELAVDDQVVHVHAWVFDRFAVGWDGLVYRIVHAHGRADLHADVAHFDESIDRLSEKSRGPLKLAMLARLGERVTITYDDAARMWVWALHDRAATAHIRRGDVLAVARDATVGAARVDEELRRLDQPPLSGIDDLPRLIADEQRRAKRKPVGAGVDALVDQLADDDAAEGGFVGAKDPIVDALVALGPPVVDRLIEVVATDQRLTLQLVFTGEYKAMVGVEQPATRAIERILEHQFYADSRADNVKQMRAYWAKWRDVPLEERWYRVLADDAADPHEHVMSALAIVQPGAGGMRGESLRAHASPTVSDVLARRIEHLDVDNACYLADALHSWDAAAAKPALVALEARAITTTGTGLREGSCIAKLAMLRASDGDFAGIDEDAHWLAQTVPDGYSPNLVLEAVATYRTRPAVASAVATMFRDGSPWLPLVADNRADLSDVAETDLVELAPLAHQVSAALADKRTIGKIEVRDDGYSASGTAIGSLSTTSNQHYGRAKYDLRLCDWVAYKLGHYRGMPFELWWPEHQRDSAIDGMRHWLASVPHP